MPKKKGKVLITGAAGFIGFHVANRLLNEDYSVVGLDNLNTYYDVNLKESRLNLLRNNPSFKFVRMDLTDKSGIDLLFEQEAFKIVINLAAQAGVRYSIQHPYAYLESNMIGFLNVLEACRHFTPTHLIYASSSSVYGANRKMPLSVHDNVDHPLSLYAATKKSNELMAHTYSNLYGIPTTGLRFFTVYGPYGRPDMALFLFTKAILEGNPIDVYNFGKMKRDFTYVDDIVEGIFRLMTHVPKGNTSWNGFEPDPASSFSPYRLYNIGNNHPVTLDHFIGILETKIGKKAIRNLMPIQPGDVEETFADINDLASATGFSPATPLEQGLEKFVKWYKEYYKIR
ncbi:MAG: NAD-dependent epimerase [Bacteroidetes bacterium]|nr:NAD-dependent epimerase [Bacteroidota bacterium]